MNESEPIQPPLQLQPQLNYAIYHNYNLDYLRQIWQVTAEAPMRKTSVGLEAATPGGVTGGASGDPDQPKAITIMGLYSSSSV